jgi:phage terminase Nu1 subunit (DNA packaging protein)
MNLTRNGKIARLPLAVRQELNRRLDEGEQGKKLVAWLNALSEVQTIVAAEFGGKPIREQNLSEWKQGGYRDWLAKQEALEIAERLREDATEWARENRAPLSDMLTHWLAARYAVATRRLAETSGPEGWRLLREMCGDIVELRKGDHSAERLRLDRERLALAKEKAEQWTDEKLEELLKQPETRQRLCGQGLSAEERARRMREIFGLPPQREEKNGLTPETLAKIERAVKLL